MNPNEDTDELTAKQGHNLMAVAAKRVWEELYVAKKPAIEEVNTIYTTLVSWLETERGYDLAVWNSSI